MTDHQRHVGPAEALKRRALAAHKRRQAAQAPPGRCALSRLRPGGDPAGRGVPGVILVDIIIKALPAFTQSSLTLDVPVTIRDGRRGKTQAGDYDGARPRRAARLVSSCQTRAERRRWIVCLSCGRRGRLAQTGCRQSGAGRSRLAMTRLCSCRRMRTSISKALRLSARTATAGMAR